VLFEWLLVLFLLQARRKVTGKAVMDEICDRAGVAVISRGAYVAPGKKLEPGERKLFLLIEGNNEMSVKQAKLEILKVLEDETIRLSAAGSIATSGRYSVL
jgi:ATP-dependent RNA helicase DDX46/PRP5